MELNGAKWRKSSWSNSNGGACVEVAGNLRGVIAIRDSKNPGGAKLVLTPAAWETFAAGVRAGDFDLA
jgi:uncharacterized protein DUF397